MIVVERACAKVVAGAEQLLLPRVPDGECKVTDQAVEAVLASLQVRLENDLSVEIRVGRDDATGFGVSSCRPSRILS